jgi:glycosyltransferase involved in cell wall biosynthesis
MKLLFSIKGLNSAVGGAERVLCTVCSELVKRGHDVAIVTFDQPGGQPFYSLNGLVRRIDLGIGNPARHARLSETLCRMRALRHIVMEERPHVAIGFMHSMFVPMAFALAGTGIPVVGSEHIVPEHYRTRPLQYAMLIAASSFLAKMTVLSEAIRSRYPAPIRERMIVVPNPVSPPVGQNSLGVKKFRHVLLNVGRLDAQKDQATLLRAFAHLANDHPDWELRVIGDGPLRGELETLVQELDLEGRVYLPGVKPDIEAEYCSADAFVISSRYEAFGLVTAEAMSHGLPAVGFVDCPGTNELIQDGSTGLLAAAGPDRAISLSRELARVMADPDLRRRLGAAAKATIGHRFSAQHVSSLWESLLETVCIGSGSPPAAFQNGVR